MSQLIKKRFPSITSIDVGTDGNTSFLRAARNGQLEKVLEHLESNIDINTSNTNGLNALHLASKDGHVEIVEELLKRGAVIDAATKKGNTALHIASLAGQEEVVKLLVTHGASVNVQSQNGFTPLYMAAQENHDNVVKYLLANGANQSLSTEDGFTPLAVAMQQGHDKVVTVLLENDTRGRVRLPALHIAAKKDDVKAAKLLLENEHNPDVTSKSGFTPLHIASHYGNQSIANLLVQKGADVNYAAKHNITPLHVAAKWGKTNMVTVLLEQGANIESKTRDGLTPLHCAARSGHEQVVDMLLEKGAPISSKTKNGLAPLHMAAQGDHVDAARILLYHRAPVDEVTVDYLTALHVAAHCGHVRVAKLLLDRQADANARALNGFTPLHIACKKNRIKVVELLLKNEASIGATTESGLTPLHVASFMGCMNIVIYLLQHDANPDVPTVRGETPLHLAARANQTDIIRILLRNGAQVDARAREQQTPLHIASRLGNVDIVMLLLQHGAKVDNTTKDMYTALHIAAKEGQDEVAAALIDNGASLNATTKKGFTPLHLAAKYGHLKVAKLLLQKEAPVDAQGKNGVTPLHVASHYDHQNVALLLLEKGASPYATAKNGHTPLHIAAKKNQMDIANTLLEYGAKPNAESKAGFTPLHLSAQEGHCDMTDLLIEHKADPNHTARNGLTPLHLCAQEDKVPVAEILVKNGGEVDASTKNGYTPLHIASHYGQINMVRFLLSHGGNVKATTSLGYTPLHQAAQQGHTNIVNTLLENSAQPNAITNSGQTPLHIAEKLGYITVIDTLKVVTEASTPKSASPISNEEKYRVVAPEAMHETFMSDSEEEGGEDTVLGDQTYRYLTADEMKSLGDDSLPIDVTRDERIDSNKIIANAENMLPPRHIEDNISPEHVQQNYVEYIKKYTPDNVDIDKHPISIGFLVSFLVDARGGAMRGCRHSGVRVIVPPRCAPSPTRITCRYVRPQRTPHPPPLMEGEALASRVLELGPVGAKFLGPVIIEVPHFAALRGKEREIVILRSDNGESWKEHTVEATEDILNEVFHDSFEAEDLNQLEDISSGRITRIVTQDFPQYFAVVSRIRQEVHAIGPEGGMVSSTVVPQVQAVFPQGALTKKIKVGLQAQPIDPELTAKLLGHGVAVSPVVTVEPRRRKFHKAITLSMPAPRAHSQGMINQYSGNAPTLRLLCSITGGTTRAQWEDVTGSTPLTFVNDCVSFTTTVSARFWLMDCRNVGDATKMATELYREAIHVPFMAKFVVFAKRVDPLEARLRVFCMTDDKEDKTLEHQEHFTEVAKSRDVEVLEGKPQYIEFAGNLVPITKSGEQLQFSFRAFRENRLPFSVRVKDQHAEAVSRCLFMRESKLPKGEPPQQPICILNIVLPDDIVVETISLTDSDSVKKLENFDYYRPDPRLADMSNLLGDDWVPLAAQLGLTTSEINVIKSEYPDSVAKQAQSMLRMWLSQSSNKTQTNTLESALRRIGREDIIPQCLNVDYPPHGIKEIGKQRLIKKLEENLYEKDIMRDSESVESLKKAEEEKKKENFDKYSAEEKVVEETSDEEDFNKTVTERRNQIQERLSVDRTVPASSQRVEIVQEITSIKRQSLVENKIAEVEQKATVEIVDVPKTTITSNELTISPVAEKVAVDGDRRDSALLEGVTQRFEQKMIEKITSTEDPKSPKVSKTPPPSPADFITKEQAASIQDWDVSKKSAPQEEAAPLPQDAEQQGLSTTTERLVASNEETLLDKPLGQQLTGLSVIDDYLITDLKTVCEQTNAFIQSESQPEPYDALADKYTRKEPINDKKIDDNKNNVNEKKKAKKGFFGSIKTFVERSFESDSESEKSPKKSKKPKKDKKKKVKEEATTSEPGLPPRKPKLPTPPLEPSDIDSIPFAEASVSDFPPPYKPPDVPEKEEYIPVTDLDADAEVKPLQIQEAVVVLPEKEPQVAEQVIEEKVKEKAKEKTKEKEKAKEKEKSKEKEKAKEKEKEKKKAKQQGKTIISEEVTKTIEPLVIEAEEFSIVVDPTKKESPKKSKETFTINIDESIERKEKEILEKSPILSEEKIVKPIAALERQGEVPIRPPRIKDHVYEDIEEPTIPQERVKEITNDLIQNEINFGGWSEVSTEQQNVPKEIVEKHDKEVVNEKDEKRKAEDTEGKKREEKKGGGFFGLFKKKDSKRDEEVSADVVEVIETETKPSFSEEVIKNMNDSRQFLSDEVENYHDVHPVVESKSETIAEPTLAPTLISEPEAEESKSKSEGFFGLFKKTPKEERAPADKKVEDKKTKKEEKPTSDRKSEERKSKKEDRKSEEKKVAVLLSEEVLKNILDSKRFLEGEVQNYHDVRAIVSEKEVTEHVTEDVKYSGQASDEPGERSPKKDRKQSKDEKREPSPKPSPGFFGIFKKSKRDETDIAEMKPAVFETIVKEVKEKDEILTAEIEDVVKPVTEDKKIEDVLTEAKVVGETAEAHSGGFLGLFKKSKKEEDGQPQKPALPETVLRDMTDTTQFLIEEVQNYDDVRPTTEKISEEEKVTESAEQPSSGFFGLFKKNKKEDEKIVPEVTKEVMESATESIKIEETVGDVLKVEEDKIKKAAEEVRESSPKPTTGFFGLFKKSKKDEEEIPAKPPLSDSVLKEIEETNQFLSTEVDNYDDTKPEKFETIQEEKTSKVESSPKPSKGMFGIFKTSKKSEEGTEPILSEAVVKDMEESKKFLKDEVENYHDSQSGVETEKVSKVIDGFESSPKTSRGLFGMFKKSKKDSEEVAEATPMISEAALQAMNDTKSFLMGEVDNFHDVKPDKFEEIAEEKVVKVEGQPAESSPKPSRGLFGMFKKSKKEQEEVSEVTYTISDSVEKDMAVTDTFLTVEVEHYDDVKPVSEEKEIKVEESVVESSPKTSRGLFGIFKKSKKDEEQHTLSETVVKEMEGSKQFLVGEVDNYHDVKLEKPTEDEPAKISEEVVETSTKPSRGLFGIFKSPKKDKEEPAEGEIPLSEETLKNMADSSRFLSQEIENYHDVKVNPEESATKVEETREASPRPSSGIFGIFKKSKKGEVDVAEPKITITDSVEKDIAEVQEAAVEKLDDIKPTVIEEVQITAKSEGQEMESKPSEVKGGFLSKFKKTKKKPSVETQLSEEVQKSVDETKHFISIEVENYDDAKLAALDKEKKEEKIVTFDATKSKMVLEGHLPQPEIAQVVDVVKTEITDLAKGTEEEEKEVQDVVLEEATEILHVVEPPEIPSKKDKQGKDKKGFFHRFGKKSKSQETSFEEPRGRSEDETEGSPKKQKRRKSSSPFKFFDKMRKSEEEVKEVEEPVPLKTDDETKDEVKDDLLAVEFEEQPVMDLSEEVLSSLDRKMEELKSKYTPEVQKEINDCRDFLFIEVDNYEDAKPVVVTDIDTGLSNDAEKAVDDIIDKAAKTVEDTKDAAKIEMVESEAKISTQIDDSAKKAAKKTEKKSGGFFSKLGSFISGSADDAKSEIKEAKKSAEKVADKAKESTEKIVDSTVKTVKDDVKKIKEKAGDTEQAASDIITETQSSVEELQAAASEATSGKVDELGKAKETITDKTAKTVDETKHGLMALKETLLETSAKVRETTVEIKESAVDTTQEKIKDAKKVAEDKMEEIKQSAHELHESALETTSQKVDELVKVKDDVTDKASKKVEETKEGAMAIKELFVEGTAKVGEKIDDVAKSSADITQEKLENTKKQATDKITEIKSGAQEIQQSAVKTTSEKVDECAAVKDKVVGTMGMELDRAKQSILEYERSLETTAEKIAEQVEETKNGAIEKTREKLEDIQNVVKDIKQAQDSASKTTERKVVKIEESVADATAKKVDETKQSLTGLKEYLMETSVTAVQKIDDKKQRGIDETQAAAIKLQEVKDTTVQKTQDVKESVEFSVGKAKFDILKFGEELVDTAKGQSDKVKQTMEEAKVTIQETISDTGATKTNDLKQQTSAAAAKKVELLDQTKQGIVDIASKKGIEVKREIVATAENGQEIMAGAATAVRETAAKKTDVIEKVIDGTVQSATTTFEDVKTETRQIKDTIFKKVGKISSAGDKVKTDVKVKAAEATDQFGKLKDHAVTQVEVCAEETKETAKMKIGDLAATKDRLVENAAGSIIPKTADLSKKEESVKRAISETFDEVATTTGQQFEHVVKSKDSILGSLTGLKEGIQESAKQKVEEVAKVTENLESTITAKVDDVSKAASQKITQIEASKETVADAGAQKKSELQKAKEAAKALVTDEVEQAKATITEKIEEASVIKDEIKHATERQEDKLAQIADQEADKLTESMKHAEDIFMAKIGGVVKVEEDVKSAVTAKTDDSTKIAAQQVDELVQAKERTQDNVVEKVDKFSKITTDKVDVIRDHIKETSTQKKDEVSEVLCDKIDDFDKAMKTLEDTAKQQTERAAGIFGKFTEVTTTKTEDATRKTESIKDVVTSKVEEVSATQESVKKTALQKTADVVDEVGKKKEMVIDDVIKVGTDGINGLQSAATQKIHGLVELKDISEDSVLTKVDDISKATTQEIQDLKKTQETTKDLAKPKLDDFDKITAEKVEAVSKAAVHKTDKKIEEISKAATSAQDAVTEKLEDSTKLEESVFDDLTKLGKRVEDTSAKIREDLSKMKEDVSSTKESKISSASKTVENQRKAAAAKMTELDDQLAQLTSSLEQLSEPFTVDREKIKSYVTSPTMARRAESQRISREERPTVREVKTMQADDDSDEERYTVTEPEDDETQKRKPLFHLESEEDDSMESTKSKDRRDSVRSNVLETLTEDKLDNVLSDLEVQLVKDLERSVAGEEEKAESKLSKAEDQLEEIKKDSQADVEQIEQKLRDLDKALDSLEQASDPKLEKKLHRVERKFERMASEVMEKDVSGVSPTEVEARRENEFQKLVSQLSTEEVSDFQKEYGHLWDETTFSKSDDWDSKTPDSQVDVQELPQGEESSFAATGGSHDSPLKAQASRRRQLRYEISVDDQIEVDPREHDWRFNLPEHAEGEETGISGQQTDQTSSQQRPVPDQHQLSEEMKQLLKELEKESKQ